MVSQASQAKHARLLEMCPSASNDEIAASLAACDDKLALAAEHLLQHHSQRVKEAVPDPTPSATSLEPVASGDSVRFIREAMGRSLSTDVVSTVLVANDGSVERAMQTLIAIESQQDEPDADDSYPVTAERPKQPVASREKDAPHHSASRDGFETAFGRAVAPRATVSAADLAATASAKRSAAASESIAARAERTGSAWSSGAPVAGRVGLHAGSAAFPDLLGMQREQQRAIAEAQEVVEDQDHGLRDFMDRITISLSDDDLIAAALAAGVLSAENADVLLLGRLLEGASNPRAGTASQEDDDEDEVDEEEGDDHLSGECEEASSLDGDGEVSEEGGESNALDGDTDTTGGVADKATASESPSLAPRGSWARTLDHGPASSTAGALHRLQRLLFNMDKSVVALAWEAAAGDAGLARELLRASHADDMATAELLEAEAIAAGALPADGSSAVRLVDSSTALAYEAAGSASVTPSWAIPSLLGPPLMARTSSTGTADGEESAEVSGKRARRHRALLRRRQLEREERRAVRRMVAMERAAALAAPQNLSGSSGAGGAGRQHSMASTIKASVRATAAQEAVRSSFGVGSEVVGERQGVSGATYQVDVLRANVAVEGGGVDAAAASEAIAGVIGGAFLDDELPARGRGRKGAGTAGVTHSADAEEGDRAGWQTASRGKRKDGAAAGAALPRKGGSLGMTEALAQSSFAAANRRARALQQLRSGVLQAASRCHSSGNSLDAASHSERARRLKERIRAAQRAAAEATLRLRNAREWAASDGAEVPREAARAREDFVHAVERGEDLYEAARRTGVTRVVFMGGRVVVPPGGQVDLHGQLVDQAIRILRDSVFPAARRDGVRRFSIVTGRGAHSKGGHSRLRGAVERWLRSQPGVSFTAATSSVFAVRLR